MTSDEKHAVLDIAIEMAYRALDITLLEEEAEWLRAHAHALRDIALAA
jgi:hypothetical protein